MKKEFFLFKEKTSTLKKFHIFIMRRSKLIKNNSLLMLETSLSEIEEKIDYIRLLSEHTNFPYEQEKVDWPWHVNDKIKKIVEEIEQKIMSIS